MLKPFVLHACPTRPLPLPTPCLLLPPAPTQATVQSLGHGETELVYWHVSNLELPEPRGGIGSINVLSLHINNVVAKKPVAGPRVLAARLDEALRKCPEVDFVTGDLNGARKPIMFSDLFTFGDH